MLGAPSPGRSRPSMLVSFLVVLAILALVPTALAGKGQPGGGGGVGVTCSQNGVTVYRADKGFYVGWPWSKDFWLQSSAWTSGAASCTAELYSQNSDGTNRRSLATMSFPVAA